MTGIDTTRLHIRQFTLNDAAFIMELVNTPLWIQFIGDKSIHNLEQAKTYLAMGPLASYKRFGFGLYLVCLKHNGEPIGTCGLIKRESLQDVDIGFAFLPGYMGQGFAAESVTAVLDHAKQALNLPKIVAITLPNNQSCIRLLERSGMQFEKLIRIDNEELALFKVEF